MGDLGAGDLADAVAQRLDDAVPAVRRAAAAALAACGVGARGEALHRRLEDPDAGVRAAAARALKGSKAADTAEALGALLDRDRYEAVRVAAAEAMTTLSGAEPRLVSMVKDRSKHVRLIALRTVSRMELADAVPALLIEVRDGPQPEVRTEAARALGRIRSKEAVERLTLALIEDEPGLQAAAEEALTAILGKAADPGALRADGHIALERWEDAAALGKAALRPLIRALDDRSTNQRNTSARCGAARALGAIGRKEATPALLGSLDDYSPQVRQAAAEALGLIGGDGGRAGLVQATGDLTDGVREAAVVALGRLGEDDTAVEAVLRCVGDRAEGVRRAALKAVATLGDSAVAVARRGLKSNDLAERLLATQGLAALKGAGARDALHDALADHSGAVRETARAALTAGGWRPVGMRARRTDPGFARWYRYSEWAEGDEVDQVAVLVEGLSDEDPIRRRGAAETLGECGDSRAEAPLRALLDGDDGELAAVAGVALLELGVPAGEGPSWAPAFVARADWGGALAAGEAALPALARELDHPEASIRAAVLRTAAVIGGAGGAAVALRAWDDRDEEVRAAARAALAALSPRARSEGAAAAADVDDRWLPGVVAAARNAEDPGGRAVAVDLLAGIRDDIADQALATALDSDQPLAQAAALRAVARRKDAGAQTRVEGVIARAATSALRIQAAETLAAIAGADSAAALSVLLLSSDLATVGVAESLLKKLLGDDFDRTALEIERLIELERWEAAASRGPDAVTGLEAVAADQGADRRRRSSATRALAAAGGKAAVEHLRALATDADPAVREAACDGLAGLSEEVPEALADPAPAVRAAAARTAAPADLAPLLSDDHAGVVQAALQALIRHGRKATPILVQAVEAIPSHPAKRLAIQGLGAIGDPAASDPLIGALIAGDHGVRHAARQALVACGWRPVGWRTSRTDAGFARWTLRTEWQPPDDETPQIQLLAATLGSDEDPVRRRLAAETLGDFPADAPGAEEMALPALLSALTNESEDIDVRMVAAQSAVAMGAAPEPDSPDWTPFWAVAGRWDLALQHPDAARPALLSMLKDRSAKVRLGAVGALAQAASPDVLDALRPLAESDPDKRVREAAEAAVGEAAW